MVPPCGSSASTGSMSTAAIRALDFRFLMVQEITEYLKTFQLDLIQRSHSKDADNVVDLSLAQCANSVAPLRGRWVCTNSFGQTTSSHHQRKVIVNNQRICNTSFMDSATVPRCENNPDLRHKSFAGRNEHLKGTLPKSTSSLGYKYGVIIESDLRRIEC
jgi:hypothetical protein